MAHRVHEQRSTVSQGEGCWGQAVRWSRTPACTPGCRGALTFCHDTQPLLTSGAARCLHAHCDEELASYLEGHISDENSYRALLETQRSIPGIKLDGLEG